MTAARAVISIVPSTAGPIPPTPAGSTFGGIGPPVRKDQLMAEAPLAITVYRTKPSGISRITNAVTIAMVTIWFLVRRQPAGSRRSISVISIVPSTAGPIPPTPAGSTFGGIGPPVRKDQLMAEAPLAITVYRTKPSGISRITNAVTIAMVTIWFLVRRQPAGSRRSTW